MVNLIIFFLFISYFRVAYDTKIERLMALYKSAFDKPKSHIKEREPFSFNCYI